MNEKCPTQEYLRENYEYRNGDIIKKGMEKYGRKTPNRAGYWVMTINKTQHRVSRMILIFHNGEIPDGMHVDHINRDKNDNRIENLRLTTAFENSLNKEPKSGAIGISKHKRDKKWHARIRLRRP